MANFIDEHTGSKLATAMIYCEHDGEDTEGCGYDLAIGFVKQCYEIMIERQKKAGVTGEAKTKLDAGVKTLRGFLCEFTNWLDDDPLAKEEAAARLKEARSKAYWSDDHQARLEMQHAFDEWKDDFTQYIEEWEDEAPNVFIR